METPPTPSPVRSCWTAARQRLFLVALIETGNVSHAARAAGMSRSSAHRLRARLAGTAFDRQWDRALALHGDSMANPFGPDPLHPGTPGKPR